MNALEQVNILILLVTISYMMAFSSPLAPTDDLHPHVRRLITGLTSVGLVQVLIPPIYWMIHRSGMSGPLWSRRRWRASCGAGS